MGKKFKFDYKLWILLSWSCKPLHDLMISDDPEPCIPLNYPSD